MPTYTVKDIKTQHQWDVICSWNELQELLDNTPDLVKVLSAPNFSYSGVGSLQSKVPDGFKDKLKQIKKSSGRGNTIKI
tara:strand:+ start:164 stop:400 length:237 start_codon:yes stop_codon:yes gene_type:complete